MLNLQRNFINNEYIASLNFILLMFLPVSLLIGSAVINFVIILFDILFLIDVIKKKEKQIFNEKHIYLLFIIWFYLIINSFIGIDFESSIVRSIGFIRFVILAVGINYYFRKYYDYFLNNIIKIWSLIFIVVTIDLIFETIFGFNLTGNISPDKGRLSGFLGEELKIGNYYFGFILITLSYLLLKFKNNYILFLFSIIFIIVALLIGERSNFLKVLFILPLFLFFFENKNFLKKIFVIFISVTILFSIVYTNNNYKTRFWEMLLEPLMQAKLNPIESLKTKMHGAHYDTAIKIFTENKLSGIGLKNFRKISGDAKYKNADYQYTDYRQTTHPHQMHFEILSELGLIGYALFGLFFYMSISSYLKTYKKSKNLFQLSSLLFIIATIIPLLPSGSFFTTYTASIFWVNYGLLFYKKY